MLAIQPEENGGPKVILGWPFTQQVRKEWRIVQEIFMGQARIFALIPLLRS